MSQLVRLEGKHSTQNAHCALQYLTVQEARIEIIIIQSSLTPTPIRFKIAMETGIPSTKTMSPHRFKQFVRPAKRTSFESFC